MPTEDLEIKITASIVHLTEAADIAAEEIAKAAWEALVAQKPEPGSILRYHLESAKDSVAMQFEDPTSHPEYYVLLMEEIGEYEYERKEHGDDETYLAFCNETYGMPPAISIEDLA